MPKQGKPTSALVYSEYLLVLAIFFPMAFHGLLSQYLVFPTLIIAYSLICALQADRASRHGAGAPGGWLVIYALFAAGAAALAFFVIPGELNGQLHVFVLLWPLAVFAFIVNPFKADSLTRLRRAWLVASFASVPMALYEFASRSRIFDSRLEVNVLRASAGQEHPIVLGVLLTAAIPMLMTCRPIPKILGIAVLMFGIATTGSLGPLAVGAIMTVLTLVNGRQLAGSRLFTGVAAVGAIIVFAIVANFALTSWSTVLGDTDPGSYNDQYRFGLYALVPSLIRDAPFGYGIGGLPEGQYYFASSQFGYVDVSRSVDSEFVFLASQFGLLGVAIALVAVYFAIKALYWQRVLAIVFLSFLMNGFTVALHAWPGITIATGFLFAACGWMVTKKRAIPLAEMRDATGDRLSSSASG